MIEAQPKTRSNNRREKQRDRVRLYKEECLTVDAAYVMTAFGCNFEGEIPQERLPFHR